MRRYLISSAAVHLSAVLLVVLFSLFRPRQDFIMIDGFDYMGSGGGGDGRPAGGAAPKGQVVPVPIKAPVPEKPAPVQRATQAEETWKIKDAKEVKPEKESPKVESALERSDKTQVEKTNVIRIGKAANDTGDNFDFGQGGEGDGKGPGVGVGFGPGEGGGFGGFGGYLKILRQRIWSEWTQSAVYGTNQVCVVGLTVSRRGDVSDVKVEKTSGNSFYDNVALRAVRNSSPLPPLPSEFPRDSQRFRIQFRLLE